MSLDNFKTILSKKFCFIGFTGLCTSRYRLRLHRGDWPIGAALLQHLQSFYLK